MFRFKQFTIHQDHCGMKVSTDACILGAWTPVRPEVRRILDVGAGTGLLSLMLAQRCPQAMIDAVEIDEGAAAQAAENAAASPFAGHIRVHQADARLFRTTQPFDLLICNPPFFQNSLAAGNAARSKARHNVHFTPEDLIAVMNAQVAGAGTAAVLWPQREYAHWDHLAAGNGWRQLSRLVVRDSAGARISRIVGIYSRHPVGDLSEEALIIKDAAGSYTEAFIRLLCPFYLNL